MLRSVLRVAPAALRPAAVRRVATRVFAAGAITSATVATTGTTTSSGGSSVAASNTRSRGVAHVASPATGAAAPVAAKAAAKTHWSADGEGINAEQRSLAKVQSSDPVERLSAATTRELLQSACTAPGVVEATLQAEVVASSVSASGTADEESAFLAKMESEFGRDVLQVLRRQQWAVNIAATAANKDQVATLVCYFQEGTQRILYRRLTSA